MRVFHPLQHLELVVHHLLIAFDIFLEDDLDGKFLAVLLCLPDNAVRTST